MKNTDLVPKFKIFKEGRTEKPITILGDDSFNIKAKKETYISLGYTITETL